MIDSKEILEEGIPVNGMLEINTPDDKYIAPDATVWLKSGVLETDVASYPDATQGGLWSHTGESLPTVSLYSGMTGIAWDGVYFWCLSISSDTVYKFLGSTGAYTGFSFSVSAQESLPEGICWDGTHLWIIGYNKDTAYQYTTSGAYTGVSFSVAGKEGAPRGMTWDGTHFWVVGENSKAAHQYTGGGVYTGFSFDLDPDGAYKDVAWDGEYLGFASAGNVSVDRYSREGVAKPELFSAAGEHTFPLGLCWDGNSYWVISASGDATQYEFEAPFVGIKDPTISESGLPTFTRIK